MRALSLLAGVSSVAIAALVAGPVWAQQQNRASSQSAAPVSAPQADAMPTAPENDAAPYTPEPPPARMTMEDMQVRIEELQRQLDFMKQVAAEQTGTVAKIDAAPKATIANGRPGWASADGNFTAAINGVLQFDAGNYYQDDNLPAQIAGAARDLNGGTNARRARFGFGGKLFGDFDYNFLYEFGGSGTEDTGRIQELWLQYTGFLKPFHVKVGYFEPLVGMEANVSTNSIALMERASPAEVARNVAAGDTRSAIQIFGNSELKDEISPGVKLRWLASGALTGNIGGSLNSGASGFTAQPFDEQMAVVGRAAISPYGKDWAFHIGGNVQYVLSTNDNTGRGSAIAGRYTVQLRDRPELRLDGTRLVDTGALNADHVTVYGGELGGVFKNFFAQAEYFKYEIDGKTVTATTPSPSFDGYYVEGSWLITGESRVYNPANGAFNGPVVAHPFNWKDKSWGAFELAGRYSDLNLDDNAGSQGLATPTGGIRGGEQKVYSGSLNWYLNPVIRFMVQGQHVEIERLNAAGLPLNQDYNTLAVRSQLAF